MSGLYNKYIIQKADGSAVDPEAKYFVLRYDGDSRWAGICRHVLIKLSIILIQNEFFERLAIDILADVFVEGEKVGGK